MKTRYLIISFCCVAFIVSILLWFVWPNSPAKLVEDIARPGQQIEDPIELEQKFVLVGEVVFPRDNNLIDMMKAKEIVCFYVGSRRKELYVPKARKLEALQLMKLHKNKEETGTEPVSKNDP